MPSPESELGLSSFRLSLFGPMQVLIGGQPMPPLRSRKSLWLLALLALRPRRSVERSWLAGALWPDSYQDRALANLNPVLSDLRRALGEQAGRVLAPSRHTLRLDLVGADVDVEEFDSAIIRQTPEALERAVALYRGALLEDCAEEWVGQERSAREQECLRALGTLAEIALTAGEHGKAADYSRRAIWIAPRWEAAQRGLMQALSQAGDGNAAVEVYQDFVRLLHREDPRAKPGEQTTALYAHLRAEMRRRALPQAIVAAEETASGVVTGHLPHPLTDLVGREDEREEVIARLRKSRLVTLTGPGGIGKTRLALAVAAEAAPEYPAGVWLVALDALTDGRLVPSQIAEVLGLSEEADRTLLKVLTDHLRTRRLLLALDNCEHLREASAQIAEHLLRECAGLRILTTSREVLGIMGETAWMVPALAVPDSAHLPTGRASYARVVSSYEGVQLFVERAQAVQKTFTLSGDNAAAVAQICVRLGGLPLAIEMAAVRTKALTVAQIASRLDDHLSLLTGGSRGYPGRHQTLRATLDWSYSLLGETEQALLARLSVFAGGWTLDAAEAICAGPDLEGVTAGQVLDLLVSLTDKSLVVFEEWNGGGRYRVLDTIRQYAAERLQATGGTAEVRTKHRDFFLAMAEDAQPRLRGQDQVVWMRRLEGENDNLRAALAWGEENGEAGLRLASALSLYWWIRGTYSEGRAALTRALTLAGPQADTTLRANALSGQIALALSQYENAETEALCRECLLLYREAGDENEAAKILGSLGTLAVRQGNHAEGQALLEESLSIHQAFNDRSSVARRLSNLGNLARHRNETAAARALYEQSLRLFRELGDQSMIGKMLAALSNTVHVQGDYLTAYALAEESLALAREAGASPHIAEALINLGELAITLGDIAASQSFFEESLNISRGLNERRFIAYALAGLGEAARSRKDMTAARSFLGESLDIFKDLGEVRGQGAALRGLGDVARDQQDTVSAQALYRESLEVGGTDDKIGQAQALGGLAGLLLSQGDNQKAVPLWGAAAALWEKIGTPLPPSEQKKHGTQIGQARIALGKEGFTAAWEAGRALTWEQAVAYALEEAEGTSRSPS